MHITPLCCTSFKMSEKKRGWCEVKLIQIIFRERDRDGDGDSSVEGSSVGGNAML